MVASLHHHFELISPLSFAFIHLPPLLPPILLSRVVIIVPQPHELTTFALFVLDSSWGAMSKVAQGRFALRLYRIIRTLHRQLPPDMRTVGDKYARDEFKRHQKAEQKHLISFFEQWVAYVHELQAMTTAMLPPEARAAAEAAAKAGGPSSRGAGLLQGSDLLFSLGKEQAEQFGKLKQSVSDLVKGEQPAASSAPESDLKAVSSSSTTSKPVSSN